MSLDIKDMYLSIWIRLIWKALKQYTNNLPAVVKRQVEECLGLVKFGIKSILLKFWDKLYMYRGAAEGEENLTNENAGLTLRAFGLAFLADIVVLYNFKMTELLFLKAKYG
eukprot:974590-Ditylum_brightwellii.AAC.1